MAVGFRTPSMSPRAVQRRANVAAGRCRCGSEPLEPGYRSGAKCLAYFRRRNADPEFQERNRRTMRAARAKWRERAHQAGLCFDCGADSLGTRCPRCEPKHALTQHAYRQRATS